MSWVHQAASRLTGCDLLKMAGWAGARSGEGSAEVTFNSVELESWDLWYDCLKP